MSQLKILSEDILQYITEDFLDIKSKVNFANTNKNNYNIINKYFQDNFNINLINLYYNLNISCERCFNSDKIDKNVVYIDLVKNHFKSYCEICIKDFVCDECKNFPVIKVDIPCSNCITIYGERYIDMIDDNWIRCECCSKKVCGYDESEYKGEKCSYICSFCDIYQGQDNYEEIKDVIDIKGWMVKRKTSQNNKNNKTIKYIQENVDIFYNYIYACSECYLYLNNKEKEEYKKCYIEVDFTDEN